MWNSSSTEFHSSTRNKSTWFYQCPVKVDRSAELKNLLDLANSALDAVNGQEALDYANKTLEVDSHNAEAWFIKMKAEGLIATFGNMKCNEIITDGRKAIEFDNSAEMKENVYSYFLYKCLTHLQFMMTQVQDTQAIKQLFDANVQLNAFKATENTLNADSVGNLALQNEPLVLALRFAVPNSEIPANPTLAKQCSEVAKQWVYYQNAINARFNVMGTALNEQSLQRYKENLEKIKEGLPEELHNVIDGNSMTNEQKSGCYIATAVYGSYDAPEVWVLRHYRDYSLRKTKPGRSFIKAYYAISPKIADWLKDAKPFNAIVKSVLDKWVKHLHIKYNY